MATGKQEMWAKTADSVEAIIEEIDAGDLTASKQGRAFLAGAVTALRATSAESDKHQVNGAVNGL